MKIPNWAKIVWWLLLVGFFAYLFIQRYNSIINGVTTSTDIVIFLIFIVLLVIPLFQEFSIFGVSFKKEIENLKRDVEKQIISLKSDIQNTVNIYPYRPPPPDSELPDIERKLLDAVQRAWKQGNIQISIEEEKPEIEIPEDTQFLFSVRLQIERELRRINRVLDISSRPHLITLNILRYLEENKHISSILADSIREIYSICSAAIHGEEVSGAKIKFVRDVSPALINYLKEFKGA
jgi:hypothetical protein